MLRSSFVSVFIRIRVMARENPFRFEMMYRTWENPMTVNRVRQPAAHSRISTERIITSAPVVIFRLKD
jgi:hypothetical protein